MKACPTEVSEHNRCQQIKQSSNLQVLQRRGVQNLISFPAKILGSVKRSSAYKSCLINMPKSKLFLFIIRLFEMFLTESHQFSVE